MAIIFTIAPFIIILALVYNFIEFLYFDSFSKYQFLHGIPIFKQTIDTSKINIRASLGKTITTTEGIIRFSTNGKLYFQIYHDKPSFPRSSFIPIRLFGNIKSNKQINIVGRIPIGIFLFIICFTILPITALIRDGISPALLFLVAVWIFFLFGYHREKRQLENMVWELEQIITIHEKK